VSHAPGSIHDYCNTPRCRGSWPVALLCLMFVLVVCPVRAAEAPDHAGDPPAVIAPGAIIKAIEFSGNKVTRPVILEQEMLVKVGDVADPALIEGSRQAIMDLGLFVAVYAHVEPYEDGVTVHIIVKEKYYILPIPKLNRDERNNVNLGAEIVVDNLAGFNQQFKLRYETEKAGGLSGGTVTTNTVSYSYPRLLGSRFNLSAAIDKQVMPAEVLTGGVLASVYEKDARSASAQITRWLEPLGPSRGWQVGGGLVWRHNGYDYVSGVPTSAFQDAQAVGVSVLGQFTDVHDYLYSRSGLEFGYSGEYGVRTLGSDTRYTRHEFFYRKYLLLDGQSHQNVDLQGRVGLSSGDMFPDDLYAFSLGGNKSLRAYESGTFTGNTYVLANIQYLRPLFGYLPLRGALFVDIGNAYPSNNELHVGDLHWDAGIGLRLRLKSFVKIALRLDVSYARETGEVRVYAGTKEMF
jgi:outer membrane protein assembly factor BamA